MHRHAKRRIEKVVKGSPRVVIVRSGILHALICAIILSGLVGCSGRQAEPSTGSSSCVTARCGNVVSPNGDLLRAGTVNPSATHEVDGKSIGLVSVEPVILIRTADGKTDSKAAKLTQGKVYVNGGYHCEVGGDGTELKLPEGEHTIKVTGKKMATPFRNSPGG